MKKQANKKLRQQLKDPDFEVPNGKFKKNSESCDICDFGWVVSWEQYWKEVNEQWMRFFDTGIYKDPPDEEEERRNWEKLYKRK